MCRDTELFKMRWMGHDGHQRILAHARGCIVVEVVLVLVAAERQDTTH